MPSDGVVISVIITNHNYDRYLSAALDSALSQAHRPLEVVVVDDGSTDGSRELLASRSEVTALLKPAGGQTSAMNAGWVNSTGEVVVFLDADDVLLDGALGIVADAFAQGGVSVMHWPLLEIDSVGEPLDRIRPRAPLPSGDLRDRVRTLGPASYEPPPTSGNAWSRHYLDSVLPLPEIESQHGRGSAHADAFLTDLAPFSGDVLSLRQALGGYRIHGANDFASGSDEERFERDRWLYEERCARLEAFLRTRGEVVDPARWRRQSWVHRVVSAYEQIASVVEDTARFVLIDQDELPQLPLKQRALPFTQHEGVYFGPPGGDVEAVAGLCALRDGGAGAVVVAWPAFWWLDHYVGLRRHLDDEWRPVLATDEVQVWLRD